VPEVDDALRRLVAAFGPADVVEVVSTDPADLAAAHAERAEEADGAGRESCMDDA
jgi:hypothetical protein